MPNFKDIRCCFRAAATLALAIASAVAATAPVNPSPETFVSAGKNIHLERFAPQDTDHHPAILILYGASGLPAGQSTIREYAQNLAENGFVAFLVHYFDATGSDTAGQLPVKPGDFRAWTQAVEDAISYASRDPQVQRHRIGLLGFSLGAFLALWESSQDTRVAAVAEYYGGTSLFLGPPQRMPATLILHGEQDQSVPVEEARRLERLLQAQRAPYEIKVYPGEGHGFDEDSAAGKDAWKLTLAFFQKYLARH